MVKLQESKTGQKTVSVPEQFCRLLGWEKGRELVWIPGEKGELRLKEMPKT